MASGSYWNWKRYWIPREALFESVQYTFLPSHPPETYRTSVELSEKRFLILLGEPGAGKSVEMAVERDRIRAQGQGDDQIIFLDGRTTIHTEGALHRYWFDSKPWKSWVRSNHRLWVFFDGYDESAQAISNLNGVIQTELGEAIRNDSRHSERLFFRVGSRSTGWNDAFGNSLSQLLHIDDEKKPDAAGFTFHIAPPRWDDLAVAAETEGVDGTNFCQQLTARGVEALALRPTQLGWLFNIFRIGDALPADKQSLYWDGIRQHCMDSGSGDESEVFRAVAGRVAFVTKFGGYQSILRGIDRGAVPTDSIPLRALIGGTVSTELDTHSVSSDLLQRFFKSGLFTQIGTEQVVWFHQSFPEYLAAKHCVSLDLPLSQVTNLISNGADFSKKVIPGMVEVAAWMASMSPQLLDHLLVHDPVCLIESDVALSSEDDRKRLLIAFVEALKQKRAVQIDWPGKSRFDSLNFAGIENVIAPYISDSTLNRDTRDTAIDIASGCTLDLLAPVLASIALDRSEPEVLRRSAAWAVTRLGDIHSHQTLKKLLDATPEEDPFEDLRGCALRANWPSNLSIDEVLRHIGPPRWEGLGAYRLFLTQEFVEGLSIDSLLPTLEWLNRQSEWKKVAFDLERVEAQLMQKALAESGDVRVFAWLATRVASNLSTYQPLFGGGSSRPRVEIIALVQRGLRRALWVAVSDSTEGNEKLGTIAYSLGHELHQYPSWIEEDFTWFADRLNKSVPGSSIERFWLGVIQQAFDFGKQDQISILFGLYQLQRFKAAFSFLFAPVEWRSEEADKQRKNWRAINNAPTENSTDDEPRVSVETYIRNMLEIVDKGSPYQWWLVDYRLLFDNEGRSQAACWDTEITAFPSWQLCSADTRRRVVDSALPFLEVHIPRSEHIGTDTYFHDNNSAYRALVLMKTERPRLYHMISSDLWLRLGPVIMGLHPSSSDKQIPHQHELLRQAMDHGFDPLPWLELMASRVKGDSAYYMSPVLNEVISLSTDGQLSRLSGVLISEEFSHPAMHEAVRRFYDNNYSPTFSLALHVAASLSLDPDKIQDTVRLLVTILEHLNAGEWHDVSPVVSNSDDLFKRVFLSFGHWHHNAVEFGMLLGESEVAELYLKLVEQFPAAEDIHIMSMHTVTSRESLGSWREELLGSLTLRGTWEAVAQLRRLAQVLPEIVWLPRRVAEAEEEARRKTWQPPSLENLQALVRSGEARIIETSEQLHDVLIESLTRLQSELTAESPSAIDLWNFNSRRTQGTPKNEELISDFIKRFLDRDLQRSGIIVNREVVNRVGNENDIYVQCLDPKTGSSATVVCEVKGCWNKSLYTDMESQLRDRYLMQQGHSHGIYLAAFFDCDRWEPTERQTRHRSRNHSLTELQQSLAKQASRLTNDSTQVTSVILDCRF